jgi:hypothetical protein
MKKRASLRIAGVIAAFLVLCWLPPAALAQRGGHGGGMGGFHGGGSFHGGGYGFSAGHGAVGGYHGGGYHAGRGYYGYGRGYGYSRGYGWGGGYAWGRYGWGGRYWWGYPRYGWGWGLGFGWPYWGWGWGYPYGYSYAPWYYAPYPNYYPYPSDCPPGYTCTPNNDPPPSRSGPKAQSDPAKPWRPAYRAPNANYEGGTVAGAPVLSVDRISAATTSNSIRANARVAKFTTQANFSVRPQVQHAMQELREMPPFAREREIETGRYSHFSAEERELLRTVE